MRDPIAQWYFLCGARMRLPLWTSYWRNSSPPPRSQVGLPFPDAFSSCATAGGRVHLVEPATHHERAEAGIERLEVDLGIDHHPVEPAVRSGDVAVQARGLLALPAPTRGR